MKESFQLQKKTFWGDVKILTAGEEKGEFKMPDSDGLEFEEFLNSLKDGDIVTISLVHKEFTSQSEGKTE